MDAINFHDRIASVWDKKYEVGLFRQRAVDVLAAIKSQSTAGQSWVDAGCGTGYLSARMASLGLSVHGVDASPSMVEAARRLVCDKSVSFSVVRSIDDLPFGDCALDGILCSSVLEYVKDPLDTLSEFHRLLRPQGVLVVTVPNAMNYMLNAQKIAYRLTRGLGMSPWPEHLPLSVHHYRKSGVSDALSNTGFDCISVTYTAAFPAVVKMGINSGLLLCVARKR